MLSEVMSHPSGNVMCIKEMLHVQTHVSQQHIHTVRVLFWVLWLVTYQLVECLIDMLPTALNPRCRTLHYVTCRATTCYLVQCRIYMLPQSGTLEETTLNYVACRATTCYLVQCRIDMLPLTAHLQPFTLETKPYVVWRAGLQRVTWYNAV